MALSVSASLARPTVAPRRTLAVRQAKRVVVAMGAPKPEAISEAIKEAEDACSGGSTGECASAWDTVEELSAAASHVKDANRADPKLSDPLEKFCDDNPDADECRVYED